MLSAVSRTRKNRRAALVGLCLGGLLLAAGVVVHTPSDAEANGFTVVAVYDMEANTCGVGGGSVEGAGRLAAMQTTSGVMHVSCTGMYAGVDLESAYVATIDCAGVGGHITLTPSKRFSFTCTYPPDPI